MNPGRGEEAGEGRRGDGGEKLKQSVLVLDRQMKLDDLF